MASGNNIPVDTVHKTIIFEDVAISFEDQVVLDGVSFELKRGETKALLGVAGSGKSTILKLCLGLIKPDQGHIYVLGHDVTTMREEELFDLRNQVGIVFQESALFDSLTVRENVAFRLMEEKLPEGEIEKTFELIKGLKAVHPECEIILYFYSPTPQRDPAAAANTANTVRPSASRGESRRRAGSGR